MSGTRCASQLRELGSRAFLPMLVLGVLILGAPSFGGSVLHAQQPEAAADSVPLPVPPADSAALPPILIAPGDTLLPDSLDAGPPLSASADSVLRILRALPGFTVTEYEGTNATYRAGEGVLRLEGQAAVTRGGDRLTADTIVFRERTEIVEAYGGPRVVGQNQDLEGDILFYDLASRRATALGARTQITEAATWYVRGDVTIEGTDTLFGSHARFTSCDLETPHYHFETDRVMVIRDRILVARPARLYFGDVPVMVLPFVVHNLEQGRRSGFLTPRFGVNDVVRASSGYNRQISDVGFYWAINQYMGAQLSTTWRSGAYTALLGTLDYNWREQFLNGSVGVERYWRAEGGRELSLRARSAWRPDERTSLTLSGDYASSADFVRDASYDPREVTRDLHSTLSVNRTFDWGSASFGAQRRQSIATGDVSMTLPSLSLSLPAITLFEAPTPEQARWYSGMTFNIGGISGARSLNDYADERANRRDQEVTRFRMAPSFSVGNFRLNSSVDLNRAEIRQLAGIVDPDGAPIDLAAYNRDDANWSAGASYQQTLIGSTNISPNVRFSQQLVRDTITGGELIGAPVRLSFGSSLGTDLFGFFPGVGGFTGIRHRISPRISYSYAPEVEQTALQEEVFGRAGGRAQNRISFSANQTFEAKLRNPVVPREPTVPQDTLSGDTIPTVQLPAIPSDPEKVMLLSLTTSAFEYDFVQASEEGSGFVTDRVSNTIQSDYLRGLTIQMQHELFDRRRLDPNDGGSAGELGTFAPQLSSLSTSFQLGPQSSLILWLQRIGGRLTGNGGSSLGDGILPGPPEGGDAVAEGQGTFTGNDQGTGAGPWNVSLSYQYSRPARIFSSSGALSNEAVQTLDGNMAFQLTPNWSVTWATGYSLTDGEFGSHRLNFQRDLHEWQANFSFYQTPNGNSAFEFFVELTHNRDLRFDYAERNLGIDRAR